MAEEVRIWIVNDGSGLRQMALDSHFSNQMNVDSSILSLELRAWSGRRKREDLLARLMRTQPVLVWILLYGFPGQLSDRDHTSRSFFIEQLVRAQLGNHGHVILEANPMSNAWRSRIIEQVCSRDELRTFLVKHCNLGVVHRQSLRPPRTTTQFVSSLQLPHCPTCECGSAESEHINHASGVQILYKAEQPRDDAQMQLLFL